MPKNHTDGTDGMSTRFEPPKKNIYTKFRHKSRKCQNDDLSAVLQIDLIPSRHFQHSGGVQDLSSGHYSGTLWH